MPFVFVQVLVSDMRHKKIWAVRCLLSFTVRKCKAKVRCNKVVISMSIIQVIYLVLKVKGVSCPVFKFDGVFLNSATTSGANQTLLFYLHHK